MSYDHWKTMAPEDESPPIEEYDCCCPVMHGELLRSVDCPIHGDEEPEPEEYDGDWPPNNYGPDQHEVAHQMERWQRDLKR